MNICITGYRPSKLPTEYGYDIHNAKWNQLRTIFYDVLHSLYIYHDYNLTLYTGMALGVDQAFAEETFKFRNKFSHVRVIAAIPCYGQEVKWPIDSRQLYHDILKKCDSNEVITKSRFTPSCMETRNQWMVNHSDIIIGVYDGQGGGTKNCLAYAKKNNKKIITINPSSFIVHADKSVFEETL